MPQKKDNLRAMAEALIDATNAFDVERALALFTQEAVIDDPSTGHSFEGHEGIRDYIERYFIGYHTVTRFLSIKQVGRDQARVRVDFAGDFGHEIGLLELTVMEGGLISRIDADLEKAEP